MCHTLSMTYVTHSRRSRTVKPWGRAPSGVATPSMGVGVAESVSLSALDGMMLLQLAGRLKEEPPAGVGTALGSAPLTAAACAEPDATMVCSVLKP